MFLRGSISELPDTAPGMMTTISLAIGVAYGYSLAVTVSLDSETLLLGGWRPLLRCHAARPLDPEMRSIVTASRPRPTSPEMVPAMAHRVTAPMDRSQMSVENLVVGDRVLVRPGEQVPIDGNVADGASSVNEAFLTGDPDRWRRSAMTG